MESHKDILSALLTNISASLILKKVAISLRFCQIKKAFEAYRVDEDMKLKPQVGFGPTTTALLYPQEVYQGGALPGFADKLAKVPVYHELLGHQSKILYSILDF
jgi:hypothetical protein